ncbi:MAG: primase-helicase family protein, partial [bacterium]
LALAGRRGCGKSLLIDLIELILGQRRANPYAFFTGKTNFNADLAGAELLAVDDEAGSSDIRSRKNFAANIKSCLFSGKIRVEAKHRCAFTFAPVWRMVIALNDEPEALLILPPMTEDIKDKIHLFHCQQKPLPMPAHTLD